MSDSSRLYFCSRCKAQVIICSRCDRGQRYCAGECRHQARSESQRRAGQKYQATRAGRFNNAARQQRYRQRQQQKVTHQGSASQPLRDLLKARLMATDQSQKEASPCDALHCHFCGAVCEPFLRPDFFQRSRFKPVQSRRY